VCSSVLQRVAMSKCNRLYCYKIPRRGIYYVYCIPRQMCCSVLQCVAACCSVLQRPNAISCTVIIFHVGVYITCLLYRARCVAVCCSVLQRVGACCSMLQYVAVCCSALQCVAVIGCTVIIFHVGVYITFTVYRARCVGACCSMLQCVAQ